MSKARPGAPIPAAVTAAWVAAASAAAGCAATTQSGPAGGRPTSAVDVSASSLPPGVVPDGRIVHAVQHELEQDAALSREHVSVDSQNGVVTLQANVADRLARERAVALARVVRGVRAIVDRIVVAAVPRPDYEIDFAVAGALSRDPPVAGQRIAAQAHKAVVRLSGYVDSNAARRIAVSDVLGVPGVLDLVDDLVVRPGPRPDATLAAEAGRVVRDDPWLDDSRIRADARGGVVHLEGTVGSAAERARAENDAWSASPAGVDASRLRIDGWTDDGTLRAFPETKRDDRDLEQALRDALTRDPRVQPFAPTIDVHSGVVVLTGVAPNPEVVRAVDDDARDLPGIADVRDEMRSLPGLYEQTDAQIRDQVVQGLLRDPRLGTAGLSVDVLNGRVFLRGQVADVADRLRAVSIATSAPGTRDVDDGLRVAPRDLGVTNRQPGR